MKKIFWILWFVLCLALGGYFAYNLLNENADKSAFLIGDTTYGHYQIEMSCETCHTSPFGGEEVLQNACLQCHADELEEAQDSHPKSKFTDPRDAYRLENIDARYCISCHVEHQRDNTHAMGVTVPSDYCYHCHVETVEERESHNDLEFDSCADAGCHNYHDNRALYESFLVRHAGQPWLAAHVDHPTANYAALTAATSVKGLNADAIEIPTEAPHDWLGSPHEQAGISCASCHNQSLQNDTPTAEAIWLDKPGVEQCQQCHKTETEGFKLGKHGMRLSTTTATAIASNNLDLVSPSESHLDFKDSSLDASHGCNACHGAHTFDTRTAAVDACLSCHNDEHSRSYDASPHGQQRKSAINQSLPLDNTVSCATCHMPLTSAGKKKVNIGMGNALDKPDTEKNAAEVEQATIEELELWRVEHNQNANLRPNEKMIRPVCMSCHGLEFSIDALADPELVRKNFNGQPSNHIPSVDWAIERDNR